MRVGIEALGAGNRLDGTQTYVRNLIRGLATIDPTGDYTLLVRPSFNPGAVPGAERMSLQTVQSPLGRLPVPLASSLALMRARLDVVHAQFAAPLLCPTRLVVTVHDIMFERYPRWFARKQLAQLRIRVPLTVRRAAAVIADSEFSRHEIIRRYYLPPQKVVVAYLAPDPMFRLVQDAARLAQVRTQYRTGERFLLFVGALKPNKNLRRVIEAYVRLRSADAIRHRLVLVGATDWLDDQTFAPARAAGLMEEVVCTGHVPEQDLVALYNAAEVFVHPSLFEGFGLPPLEAMACGTPVVTSNTTSLPEVVGDAAIMVDPLDVEALAAAIARVATDEQLRERLTARGLERAASFSWDKTARIALDVYHAVAGGART